MLRHGSGDAAGQLPAGLRQDEHRPSGAGGRGGLADQGRPRGASRQGPAVAQLQRAEPEDRLRRRPVPGAGRRGRLGGELRAPAGSRELARSRRDERLRDPRGSACAGEIGNCAAAGAGPRPQRPVEAGDGAPGRPLARPSGRARGAGRGGCLLHRGQGARGAEVSPSCGGPGCSRACAGAHRGGLRAGGGPRRA